MARHENPTDVKASATDLTFVALRLAVSLVLIWGALTKLAGGERLGALAQAWGAAGLPYPQLLVTASVGLQLILALLLLVGLFTRVAGLLNGVNFAVAAAISGIFMGANWWPFALLVVLLLHFGTRGAGRLSIDRLRARRLATALEQRSLEELLTSIGVKSVPDYGNNPG